MKFYREHLKKKKIGFDAPIINWTDKNSHLYQEVGEKHSFLHDHLDLKFIEKNINKRSFNQLIYTTNVYNSWLNNL